MIRYIAKNVIFDPYIGLSQFDAIIHAASSSLLSPSAFSSSSSYSSSQSSASSSPMSLPRSLPMSSSLCFSFSLRTAFCLRMLSFSFIMFSSKHFMVSISSCIFSSSSSKRDDFSSAYWISLSRSYTCTLISSSWLCFQRASREHPRACMACLKRWFLRRRLMMFPPLRSWIFLTLSLTFASKSLICTSYSWVSFSTFQLKVRSWPSFSSVRALFSVSSSICFLRTCSQLEVMPWSISFCFEFSSTILRFISARFFFDSSTKRRISARRLLALRCAWNWAMRCFN